MALNAFWKDRKAEDQDSYGNLQFKCPWCPDQPLLSMRVSKTAANPGRTFVSCSADKGGCGLFCFLDDSPNDKFAPNNRAAKKARTDSPAGLKVVGPIAAAPSVTEERLAQLATKIDQVIAIQTEMLGILRGDGRSE